LLILFSTLRVNVVKEIIKLNEVCGFFLCLNNLDLFFLCKLIFLLSVTNHRNTPKYNLKYHLSDIRNIGGPSHYGFNKIDFGGFDHVFFTSNDFLYFNGFLIYGCNYYWHRRSKFFLFFFIFFFINVYFPIFISIILTFHLFFVYFFSCLFFSLHLNIFKNNFLGSVITSVFFFIFIFFYSLIFLFSLNKGYLNRFVKEYFS